ncbi:hypothetical protein PCE1_004750 [Barthelona sp. PCE]
MNHSAMKSGKAARDVLHQFRDAEYNPIDLLLELIKGSGESDLESVLLAEIERKEAVLASCDRHLDVHVESCLKQSEDSRPLLHRLKNQLKDVREAFMSQKDEIHKITHLTPDFSALQPNAIAVRNISACIAVVKQHTSATSLISGVEMALENNDTLFDILKLLEDLPDQSKISAGLLPKYKRLGHALSMRFRSAFEVKEALKFFDALRKFRLENDVVEMADAQNAVPTGIAELLDCVESLHELYGDTVLFNKCVSLMMKRVSLSTMWEGANFAEAWERKSLIEKICPQIEVVYVSGLSVFQKSIRLEFAQAAVTSITENAVTVKDVQSLLTFLDYIVDIPDKLVNLIKAYATLPKGPLVNVILLEYNRVQGIIGNVLRSIFSSLPSFDVPKTPLSFSVSSEEAFEVCLLCAKTVLEIDYVSPLLTIYPVEAGNINWAWDTVLAHFNGTTLVTALEETISSKRTFVLADYLLSLVEIISLKDEKINNMLLRRATILITKRFADEYESIKMPEVEYLLTITNTLNMPIHTDLEAAIAVKGT